MTAYITRTIDPDNFLLGTKTSNGKLVIWTMIFVDAIGELFGSESHESARLLKQGEVYPIDLRMTFLPLKD